MMKRPTFVLLPAQLETNLIIPFWQEAIKIAQEKDFNLIISNGKQCDYPSPFYPYFNDAQENITYDILNPERMDGMVILSSVVLPFLNKEERKFFISKFSQVPILNVGYEIENTFSLLVDNKAGIREIIRHLVMKHKRTRIAFLKGTESSEDAQIRFAAYRSALEECGLSLDEKLIVNGQFIREDGINAIRTLLDERRMSFDALVCANDYMAIAAIDELIRRGISVPDDIAVTGFDNINLAQYHIPSLTTVNQPLGSMARVAFEWLYDLVANGKRGEETIRFVPAQMIVRQSCGCIPAMTENDMQENTDNGADSRTESDEGVIKGLAAILSVKKEEQENQKPKLKKLADCFFAAVKARDADIFLSWLYSYLVQEILHNDNELLYDVITDMKTYFCRDLTEEEKTWPESLFAKAQIILNGIVRMKWGYNQSIIRVTNTYTRNFMHRMSTISDQAGLLGIVADFLSPFNIECCFVTFYIKGLAKRTAKLTWEVPEQSQLVLSSYKDGKTIYAGDGTVFPTRELLPANFYPDSDKPFVVFMRPLYNRGIHFGNIFVIGPNIDPEIYAFFHAIICTGLMSVYLLEEKARHAALLEENKRKLEIANEKLTELDRMKTDFIQNITHEFRSPLSIIINSADLALKYGKSGENTPEQRFNIIYDSALKLNANIDKLLDLAKMDSYKLNLNITPVNLYFFLNDIADFYKSVATFSDIRIDADLSRIRGMEDFYSDRDKLEDIFNNIFSNALKFADQEAGEIRFRAESDPQFVTIIISDNGIGIEKQYLDTIFERFIQVESGRNKHYKGTGIGLAFARQLTELLKGKIRVESEGKNKGASFILEFHRGKEIFSGQAIENDSPAESEAPKRDRIKRLIKAELTESKVEKRLEAFLIDLNKDTEFDFRKAVILLVEDNNSILNIEKEYLENEGYVNFILARDGVQGVEAVYRYHPDLIVCDYNMPGMRGDEFHDELCNAPEFKQLPFIFLTVLNNKDFIKERKQKGAIAYLLKPVDESELILTVNLHLKRYMELKESLYLATVDQLTGLANKKNLTNKLMERVALRKYRHLSLIFIDIDHFKDVNDTYGHQTGDEVLKRLGELINGMKRDYDIAGRYGGEEFLLILPETNQHEALEVAKKIKDTISAIRIGTGRGTVRITASFGISSLIDNHRQIESTLNIDSLESVYTIQDPQTTDWDKINLQKKMIGEALLKLADDALYRAKKNYCDSCGNTVKEHVRHCPFCRSVKIKNGRNRIIVS
jgi:diguanylate cyclase (GGDEF)-like protein